MQQVVSAFIPARNLFLFAGASSRARRRVSLHLQRLAFAEAGDLKQRAFMMCDVAQEFWEGTAIAFFSRSVAAERLAAEVKRHESRNIILLGNVFLNLQCRRFKAQRSSAALQVEAA